MGYTCNFAATSIYCIVVKSGLDFLARVRWAAQNWEQLEVGEQSWTESRIQVINDVPEPQVGMPCVSTCSVPARLTSWAALVVSCPLYLGWVQTVGDQRKGGEFS